MTFRAEINIMPHKSLLDPQGKAVSKSMKNVGLPEIEGVRIGKHISLQVEADDREKAAAKTEEACQKLLANQITEAYTFEIFES